MKKTLSLFLIFNLVLILLLSINSKSLSKNGKAMKKQLEEQKTDVYSFGDGTDGGNSIRHNKNYVQPAFVENLKNEKLNTYEKETAEADEKESIKNYYDGESNLNTVEIRCHNYKTVGNCYTLSHCGWCGISNSCVEGTKNGPIGPCRDAKTYTYGK